MATTAIDARWDLPLCHRLGWGGNKAQGGCREFITSKGRRDPSMMSASCIPSPCRTAPNQGGQMTSGRLPCRGGVGSILQLNDCIALSCSLSGARLEVPCLSGTKEKVQKLPSEAAPSRLGGGWPIASGQCLTKLFTMFLGGSWGVDLRLGSDCSWPCPHGLWQSCSLKSTCRVEPFLYFSIYWLSLVVHH